MRLSHLKQTLRYWKQMCVYGKKKFNLGGLPTSLYTARQACVPREEE